MVKHLVPHAMVQRSAALARTRAAGWSTSGLSDAPLWRKVLRTPSPASERRRFCRPECEIGIDQLQRQIYLLGVGSWRWPPGQPFTHTTSLLNSFDALDRLGGMVPARHLEYEVVPAHEACLVLGRVEGVEVGLRPSRCAVQAGSAWPVSA